MSDKTAPHLINNKWDRTTEKDRYIIHNTVFVNEVSCILQQARAQQHRYIFAKILQRIHCKKKNWRQQLSCSLETCATHASKTNIAPGKKVLNKINKGAQYKQTDRMRCHAVAPYQPKKLKKTFFFQETQFRVLQGRDKACLLACTVKKNYLLAL